MTTISSNSGNHVNKQEIEDILSLIQKEHNFDFSRYKRASITRSINRRLKHHHLRSGQQYFFLIRQDPKETARLISDITVEYSFFFRDKNALKDLRHLAMEPLLKQKANDKDGLRAWCAGCAGGEEAYTLSICFFEASKGLPDKYRPVIFATDVDENSLRKAQMACYQDKSLSELSPHQIKRYFHRRGHNYYVEDFIKKHVCIGKHNILTDPPISRLDLISCRNVLIYLQKEAQEKTLELIHYGIKPGGFLFLGRTENLIDKMKNKFEVVSQESRIFRKMA